MCSGCLCALVYAFALIASSLFYTSFQEIKVHEYLRSSSPTSAFLRLFISISLSGERLKSSPYLFVMNTRKNTGKEEIKTDTPMRRSQDGPSIQLCSLLAGLETHRNRE
jgi:hypothetical protein